MITPDTEKDSNSVQIVRTFITTWNTHNVSAITQLLDPDIVFRSPLFSSPVQGIDARKKEIANFLTSMPDFEFKLIGIAAMATLSQQNWLGLELQLARRLCLAATPSQRAADRLSSAWPGSSA